MGQTANYQLNQWVKTDRIQMEDFNSDNAKIDAALKANADAVEAIHAVLANTGNCKLDCGSYTGTGTYGADTPNSLSFSFKPQVIFITNPSTTAFSLLLRGSSSIVATGNSKDCPLTWTDTGVSWYYNGNAALADEAAAQLNKSNTTYHFFALG